MKYSGRMVQRLRIAVWELYPHVCVHCGAPLIFETFTVEHMLPRSKGGSHDPMNCRPACAGRNVGGCGTNFSRGNRELPARQRTDDRSFFR